jgi:hypothetical protein
MKPRIENDIDESVDILDENFSFNFEDEPPLPPLPVIFIESDSETVQ